MQIIFFGFYFVCGYNCVKREENFKTKAYEMISRRELTYSYTNFQFFVSKIDDSYVAGF